MKSGRFIGVMSGTSLDGVDVVLAAIDETMVAQQASLTWPIPVHLKKGILDICQGQPLTLSQLGQLDTQLGRLFAQAVNALLAQQRLQPRDIVAIGCHGQTVWHEPTGEAPHTLQIGDNNHIVAHTGITVVGDFRRRDIALGGQGAPLVPAFHHALLGHPTEKRMVLNIGGIANLSLLFPGQAVRGYDTGPGNMLMDAWIWRQCAQPYDKDAAWAKEGQVILPLLQKMLRDPYFACVGAQKYRTRIFQLWLVRASSYGFPWRRRARCTGHAGGADGGLHRPTGAAQWRLRAADGLWRRKPESVSDGPSGGAVARYRGFDHR